MHVCSGGCHCRRVRFEIEVPDEVGVTIQSFDGRNWTKNHRKIINDPTDTA